MADTVQHSRYSASAAHRWMRCPGSMALSLDAPQRTGSRYAAEGTVAHSLAAECLTKGILPHSKIGDPVREDGFAFVIDQTMADHVQTYIDNLEQYAMGSVPLVERRVNYSGMLPVAEEDAWGTSDAIVLHPNELQVHDLKYGQGEAVDPVENEQMQLYALGALDEFGDMLDYTGDTKVTMVIHQPRIKAAPSEWSCTVEELRAFGSRYAAVAVYETHKALMAYGVWQGHGSLATELPLWNKKYLNPGEKQCRWCAAKPTCPEARNAVAQAVMASEPVTPGEFADFSVDAKPHIAASDNDWLAAAMSKIAFIKDWLKAVEVEVNRRVLEGQTVPGFKVVMGNRGDRAWVNADEAEALLKAMRLKQEQMYSFKLISPTTAEKLSKVEPPVIGARQWTKLQAHIRRAPGTPQVVAESDKRPAISATPVAEEFDDLTT